MSAFCISNIETWKKEKWANYTIAKNNSGIRQSKVCNRNTNVLNTLGPRQKMHLLEVKFINFD